MKRIAVITSILSIASMAYAQTGSQGAAAGQSSSSRNNPRASQQLPPGLQNRDQLPPGLQNRDQLPPGLQRGQTRPDAEGRSAVGAGGQFRIDGSSTGSDQSTSSAGITGTNAAQGTAGVTTTNQGYSGVAQGATTNQSGLTPTSDQGQTRTYSTNTSTTTTTTTTRDIAYTPADRTLLTQVKQIVLPMVGVTATSQTGANSAWAPVNFQIREGVVTLVGFVPSTEVKTQIEQRVEGLPGVNRVVNQLQIRESTTMGQTTTTVRDIAYTPADRTLLTQIKQVVTPLLGSTAAASGSLPVHFVVRDGTVTLVGNVTDPQQRTIVEQRIQRIPGVERVVNQVQVSQTTSTTEAVGGTGGSIESGTGVGSSTNEASQGASDTNGLSGASSGAASSSQTGISATNQFRTRTSGLAASSTNQDSSGLTPTGGQTNRTYGTNQGSASLTNRTGLPPGLRNREQLPPGLEKRDTLPPGLEKRQGTTNGSSGDSSESED